MGLILRGLYGRHRAAGGQSAHQPATSADKHASVGEREHAHRERRGQLAHGVPDHVVWPYTPCLQESKHRHLECEQGSLREHGLIQPRRLRRVLLGEHRLQQRAPQVSIQLGADLIQRGTELGKRTIELAPHARALSALSGEQEGDSPARGADRPPNRIRHDLAGG